MASISIGDWRREQLLAFGSYTVFRRGPADAGHDFERKGKCVEMW
jgi:hypothetical protein